MNKFKKTMAVLALAFTITACGGSEEEKIKELPTETIQPTTNPAMIRPSIEPTEEVFPEEPVADLYPDSGHVFALTQDEEAIYERLKSELTTDVFEGLSPISVAKIYVKCGIEGEWEAEYATHSPKGLETTKEKWQKQHEDDMKRSVLESRQSLANFQFPLLGEGEVKIDGDNAVIIYHSVPHPEDVEATAEDTYNEFHLIKNSKGIWEVRFRPHLIE